MLSWAIGCSLGAGRDPDRPGRRPRPGLPVAGDRQRLRRRHLRPAALLPLTFLGAVVLGCWGRPRRLPPGDNQYLAGLRPAAGDHPVHRPAGAAQPRLRTRGSSGSSSRRRRRPGSAARRVVIAGGFVLITGQRHRPDHLRTDLLARDRRPVARAARRLRRPDLAGAAQLAGIGAIAAGHHGVDGSPLGIVLAVVIVAALVGGIVALPLLRLSGIYLAFATAAFAWPSTAGSSTCPTSTSDRSTSASSSSARSTSPPMKLFGYTFDSHRPGSCWPRWLRAWPGSVGAPGTTFSRRSWP